jgi:hypothetical protein
LRRETGETIDVTTGSNRIVTAAWTESEFAWQKPGAAPGCRNMPVRQYLLENGAVLPV